VTRAGIWLLIGLLMAGCADTVTWVRRDGQVYAVEQLDGDSAYCEAHAREATRGLPNFRVASTRNRVLWQCMSDKGWQAQ